MKRLDELVLASPSLPLNREMVNATLLVVEELFAHMYEADIKAGFSSIAPEKLLRTLLL